MEKACVEAKKDQASNRTSNQASTYTFVWTYPAIHSYWFRPGFSSGNCHTGGSFLLPGASQPQSSNQRPSWTTCALRRWATLEWPSFPRRRLVPNPYQRYQRNLERNNSRRPGHGHDSALHVSIPVNLSCSTGLGADIIQVSRLYCH